MKRCPYCAEEIQDAAVVCRFCQRDLRHNLSNQQPTVVRTWNPGVAAVLSLFVPGAGQMYKGQIGTGFAWLFFTVASYFMFILPGIILHIICIVTAASTDDTRRPGATLRQPTPAELKSREFEQRMYVKGAYLLVAIVFVLIVAQIVRAWMPAANRLTLHVTDVNGSIAITNRSGSLLNLCWAELSGQRAVVPTMAVGQTVTMRRLEFKTAERAHEGSDLRITCNVDGSDVVARIQ